jgi:hypothetical protein
MDFIRKEGVSRSFSKPVCSQETCAVPVAPGLYDLVPTKGKVARRPVADMTIAVGLKSSVQPYFNNKPVTVR